MTEVTELTRRRFAHESRGDPSRVPAAAVHIVADAITGLARSFGYFGSEALVTRAIASARHAHPLLSGVVIAEEHQLEGLAATDSALDAEATIAAIAAVMVALSELMGRLIGDDLAAPLLHQCITTSATDEPDAPGDPRGANVTTSSRTP